MTGHSDDLYSKPAQQRDFRFTSVSAAQEDSPGKLPTLPSDILDNILGLVKQSWRARPQVLAKDEVRQWTQYSLVSKAWRAAFEDTPLCVVFDEAPSKQQVKWLRSTRTPVQRIVFLPSCTPCKSTLVSHVQDTIRLCPDKLEWPPHTPSWRIRAVA